MRERERERERDRERETLKREDGETMLDNIKLFISMESTRKS